MKLQYRHFHEAIMRQIPQSKANYMEVTIQIQKQGGIILSITRYVN